jgi:hypothetical protein
VISVSELSQLRGWLVSKPYSGLRTSSIFHYACQQWVLPVVSAAGIAVADILLGV